MFLKGMKEALYNAKRVVELVNEHRKENKLSPLELDYNLCMAAIVTENCQ